MRVNGAQTGKTSGAFSGDDADPLRFGRIGRAGQVSPQAFDLEAASGQFALWKPTEAPAPRN